MLDPGPKKAHARTESSEHTCDGGARPEHRNGNGHKTSRIVMRVQPEPLRRFVASALASTGVPPDDAAIVADCLVDADLRGIPSHGVSRVPTYVDSLQRGFIQARPAIEITRTAPATATLNGGDGLGSLVAVRGMLEAIALAGENGVGMVAVRRSSHFGHAGYYASLAAKSGCIGIVLSNAFPTVAPFGGRRAMLGTNPVAVAAPGGDRPDFVLDMSTSTVSRGWLRLAADNDMPIPGGCAVTLNGTHALTAQEALGGVLLPFGEHKGSGLAMMIDLLAGVLVGAGFGKGVQSMYVQGEGHADVGHALIAIRISAFLDSSMYEERYRAWYDSLKATPPAPGIEAVMIPGERSQAAARQQLSAGVWVDSGTWGSLRKLAGELCVPFLTANTFDERLASDIVMRNGAAMA